MGLALSEHLLSRFILLIFSKHGQIQGLLYKHLSYSFINLVTDPLVSHSFTAPPRQTVRDSSYSYKIDYVIVVKNFLNPKGH